MRLLRDLWATSARRTALVAVLVVIGAAGSAASLALSGAVLVNRSFPLFVVLAGAGTVAFEDGSVLTLAPGVVVRLHAGDRTVWTVTETLRKLYVTAP